MKKFFIAEILNECKISVIVWVADRVWAEPDLKNKKAL
jgi:hypothetical protein